MAFNNDPRRGGATIPSPSSNHTAGAQGGWRPGSARRALQGNRRIIIPMSVVLLIVVVLAALRLGAIASGVKDQLQVRIGNQQAALLDLRQGSPIDPHVYGVNVFPKVGTNSLDRISSGFMNYTPVVISGLQDMHIKVLRYPGGQWGEQHILSFDQLSDFSRVLNQTGSDGMVQAHLGGPLRDEQGNLQPQDLNTDLNSRANLAGRWVDYMNNPNSYQRKGMHAHDPYHPVHLWTVGNEPDQAGSINPLTNRPYTVAEYVAAFIQFSKMMHQNDPTIKVFGPEISQFYGVGAGPFDSGGHAWMDDFLKGVGDYERANHVVLLDGVTFHRYQFDNAKQAPALLMSSSDEWNYLLPPLRQLIEQDLGRSVPIGITEINTNPSHGANPTHGEAALWWADTLGALISQQVSYVSFFSASDVASPYPLFVSNGLRETAMARVMQLFAHTQSNSIPVGVQREPISMYATQDDTHQTVSLLFVNKGADAQIAQIRPVDQAIGISQWPSLDVTLAGFSVILVTLHHGSANEAEAYSFIATQANTSDAAPPLAFTICGHKSDLQATTVPC